jgi:hypothetical protein
METMAEHWREIASLTTLVSEWMGWESFTYFNLLQCPVKAWKKPCGAVIDAYTWNPATDHNDAFEVVRALREQGWKVSFHTRCASEWEVVADYSPRDVEVHFVETLPLAICRLVKLIAEGRDFHAEFCERLNQAALADLGAADGE